MVVRKISKFNTLNTSVGPVENWNIERVRNWAKGIQELNKETILDEDVQHLVDQRVDGKTLLKLTEEKLQKSGFTLGAAAALAEAIEKLKEVIVTLDTVDELLSGMKLHTRESFSFYDELNQPHAVDFL